MVLWMWLVPPVIFLFTVWRALRRAHAYPSVAVCAALISAFYYRTADLIHTRIVQLTQLKSDIFSGQDALASLSDNEDGMIELMRTFTGHPFAVVSELEPALFQARVCFAVSVALTVVFGVPDVILWVRRRKQAQYEERNP